VASADTSISIRNVSKSFGSTQAVRDLNLDVPRGSLCGFLGPNGAGKSTTIRMIMSIIYPDSGTIDVLGSSALRNKDRIGYLPEERGLYRKMRVGEFIEYMGRLKGVRSGLRERTQQWLERMELPNTYRKRCQELSKGMQQKVQFIAAIIHEPDLLILDEPFSGLDPVNSALLNRMFQNLHAKGVTIIFSTHVLHQAEQLCDRIFLIHKGEKLLDATLDEIRERFNPRTMIVEPVNGTINVRDLPGVISSQPIGEDGRHELRLAEGADAQQVMRAILESAPVRSVELRRITLEEVFVQMVMRDRGVEEAEIAKEELAHAQ
jgi:ABC-2 type transport system ATP-binding protein